MVDRLFVSDDQNLACAACHVDDERTLLMHVLGPRPIHPEAWDQNLSFFRQLAEERGFRTFRWSLTYVGSSAPTAIQRRQLTDLMGSRGDDRATNRTLIITASSAARLAITGLAAVMRLGHREVQISAKHPRATQAGLGWLGLPEELRASVHADLIELMRRVGHRKDVIDVVAADCVS